MKHDKYTGKSVLDLNVPVDYGRLKGKSVIVTGGASGLGEQFVRLFVNAGAFVTIGDISEEKAKKLADELGSNTQAIKCDVTSWTDQLALFKAAITKSPSKSCDIVLANAGIGAPDVLGEFEDTDEPAKPSLKTLDVNLTGTVYTAKLATHYFVRQPEDADRDRCLIMTDSLAGYADQPYCFEYNAAKYGVRSLMRTYRRTCWMHGIRVNCVSPWYVKTAIIGDFVSDAIKARGLDYALAEDVGAAVLRLAADPEVNGRALGVLPRKYAEKGYRDLEQDDYGEDTYMYELEQQVVSMFVP